MKEVDENEAVACSLAADDLGDRTKVWRELLRGRLLRGEPTDDGWVLTLSAAPGVAAAARRLAELEAELPLDEGAGRRRRRGPDQAEFLEPGRPRGDPRAVSIRLRRREAL